MNTISRSIAAPLRAALLAVMLAPGMVSAQAQSLDKIIATVDDDVVLQSEFDERWTLLEQQIANAQGPRPDIPTLKNQLLEQLIIESLQFQMASRAGLRIDDNTLNQAMTNIAAQNNMDFEQFRQVLEAQNLYAQTREQLRRDIVLNQFQTRAVNQRIDITRQEVENYLRSETGQADIAPEYRVAHILIENGPQQRQREELADLLYRRVNQGEDLLDIVNERQVLGIPISGGDLGWNKVENLPSIFAAVVPDLQLLEISEPFASPSGIHLVQVLDLRGGANLELQQYKVQHILIEPNEIRTESQAEELVRSLYQRILDGEDFGDIARQNTDDETSIVAGGDLDWVTVGEYPPDFMAAIRNAEIGKVTEPVHLSSGWHIFLVSDQRMQDMTDQNMRYQAEQILRQRKFDNELQNWLTEMRDTAYVDIKIDFE